MTRLATARPAALVERPVRSRSREWLIAAPILIVVLLVVDWGFALLRPSTRSQVWLWGTVTVGAPVWFGAVMLAGLVVTTVLLGRRSPALLVESLVTVEFGLYYFSTRVSPMTGDSPALLVQAGRPDVWASEALADAIHKLASQLGGQEAVLYVGPFFGVLAIVAWLFLARRVSAHWGIDLDLVRLFALATPLTFWFLVQYTENTFLATPFLIAGIGVLLRASTVRSHLIAGALLGLAVAMHASNLAMVAAAVLALLLGRAPWAIRIRRALVLAATSGGVVLLSTTICIALGMRFNAYNMLGGYDHTMWVPFAPTGYLFRFTFQSHAHLIEVANIAVHAAPAFAVALPLLLGTSMGRARLLLKELPADTGVVLLATMTLAYLAFVAVWGFDFGNVGDLDLMLVMDVPLTVLLLVVVHRLARGNASLIAGLIAGSAAANLAFYSYKVSLIWWPPPS